MSEDVNGYALEERVKYLMRCAWQPTHPRFDGGREVRFCHDLDIEAAPRAVSRLRHEGWLVIAAGGAMVCYPPEAQ